MILYRMDFSLLLLDSNVEIMGDANGMARIWAGGEGGSLGTVRLALGSSPTASLMGPYLLQKA